MKIIVTGGAGFIGSNIVDELINLGHDVVIVDNFERGGKENINSKAKVYKIDIRDKGLWKIFEVERPEIVYHHAAQIKVPYSIENPMEDVDINIIGSVNLLECCRKYKVKKVIYPSSAAIFGHPKYLPIDEKHPLNMLSGYGVTKHTVEHYLYLYHELYGINYTVFRYANVYGPRQDASGEGGVIAIFCDSLISNNDIHIFGDGDQTRDFVYVKDVVRANILALDGLDNDIYNVSTNDEVSINKVLRLISNELDLEVTAKYGEERVGDIKNSYMTYEKINKISNWEPKYSIKDGIKETVKYYLNTKNKI